MSDTKRGIDYARYRMEGGDGKTPPALLLEFSEIDAQGNVKTTVPLSREYNRSTAFVSHLGLEQHGSDDKIVLSSASCIIRIEGENNCRKFAGYLKAHNRNGVNNAILAVIPEELQTAISQQRVENKGKGGVAGR